MNQSTETTFFPALRYAAPERARIRPPPRQGTRFPPPPYSFDLCATLPRMIREARRFPAYVRPGTAVFLARVLLIPPLRLIMLEPISRLIIRFVHTRQSGVQTTRDHDDVLAS